MRKYLLFVLLLFTVLNTNLTRGQNTTNTFKLEYQFRDEGNNWFPLYFTLNDINGDGKKDIIASEIYRHSDINQKSQLHVLLQTNEYSFRTDYLYPFSTLEFLKKPMVCDMNKDGKQDIILLKRNISIDKNALCVFFQDSSSFHLFRYPYSGEKIHVGDMNGDSRPEILIFDQIYSPRPGLGIIRILYFEGEEVAGMDEFTIEFPFYQDHYTNKGPFYFSKFLVEDLNNDNLPDIISLENINDYYGSFSVLLNKGNHAGFEVDTTIDLNDAYEVSALDIYRKNGTNSFTLAVGYALPGSFAVYAIDSLLKIHKQYYFRDETRMNLGTRNIFCRDFDFDGMPEIICQNDSMFIFRQNQAGMWKITESFSTGDPSEATFNILVNDIDYDSDLDFILDYAWDKHYYFFINQTVQPMRVNSDLSIPLTFRLKQNYPNPFNSSTMIPFELDRPGEVSVTIRDVTGRLTAKLLDRKFYYPGRYSVQFDTQSLPSGLYFYQIETQDHTAMKKMLLIR